MWAVRSIIITIWAGLDQRMMSSCQAVVVMSVGNQDLLSGSNHSWDSAVILRPDYLFCSSRLGRGATVSTLRLVYSWTGCAKGSGLGLCRAGLSPQSPNRAEGCGTGRVSSVALMRKLFLSLLMAWLTAHSVLHLQLVQTDALTFVRDQMCLLAQECGSSSSLCSPSWSTSEEAVEHFLLRGLYCGGWSEPAYYCQASTEVFNDGRSQVLVRWIGFGEFS